jgi:biopolymer transport protein ExbD
MTPVMKFGEGKTAKQAQHDTMAELGPARLVTGEKWSGEVTTRKIRVWADNQYRTQNRQWQKSFEEPLELANLVITPLFGVRLVAEYQTWERHVPGARLIDDMAALIERDPGDDVFAVIGLTTSLPLVSATFDELGLAQIGGRHIVLRGYADLEERKLYANAFPDLRAEERELALVHLRHHKTAVVLLHEIGHVLGVEHEIETTAIMNAYYSNHATAFTPQSREIMLRTIDERLHRKSTAPQVASAPTPAAAAQPARVEVQPAVATVAHAPIVIRVTKKRALIVDGKPLTQDALDAQLKAAFAQDPKTKIVINEDRNVPTGVVGDLLDRAKAIGFTKFEFAWSGK